MMPLVNDKGESVNTTNVTPELPSSPAMSIDKFGNMTLFVPMAKTNEFFARGFLDWGRSELIRWYLDNREKQKEIASLATKTGFQRFKDKLGNLTGR